MKDSPALTAPTTYADLPRRLGVVDGAAILVGAVIGSGIFMVPSLIARRIPEPGLVLAIWFFCGLLVICGGLTLAELGAMLPRSGGVYVYVREAYGPFWGFLYGWTTMLVVMPGAVAALTSTFLLYLSFFVPMSSQVQKASGVVMLILLGWVNARGIRWGARVQNLFTFLKVAGLAGLVLLAVILRPGPEGTLVQHFTPFWPDHWRPGMLGTIGVAMISVLFAYEGWHFVGFVAGEIREPEKTVPRAIFLGVAIVMTVYLAANAAYIYVLSPIGIAASDRVAADAASAMIGPLGGALITLAILCSTFGASNANILAGPRVFFAMARDGVFFKSLAAVHPRYETPSNAIWTLSLWSALLTLTGGYEHLITMATFASWGFFTMAIASILVLRRKHPEWPRPYRLAGYPFTAIVFVVVAGAFVVNTLVEAPRSSIFGLAIVLAGVPAYLWWRARGAA
jgi:APA family basic amino acid/polyamine antiporter